MVGALNKLPVAASGMMFFGDAVTFPSVSAIFTGFVAGLVYAAAKSAQSAKAKRQSSHLLSILLPDLSVGSVERSWIDRSRQGGSLVCYWDEGRVVRVVVGLFAFWSLELRLSIHCFVIVYHESLRLRLQSSCEIDRHRLWCSSVEFAVLSRVSRDLIGLTEVTLQRKAHLIEPTSQPIIFLQHSRID